MYAQQVDLPLLTRSTLAGRAVLEMVARRLPERARSRPEAGAADRPRRRAPTPRAPGSTWRAGWALLQELRLAEAEEALARFHQTPSGVMDPLLLTFGRLLRACVLTAVGEAAEARRVLDTRGDVPERLPRYLARLDRLVRLLIAVAMGDLATVGRARAGDARGRRRGRGPARRGARASASAATSRAPYVCSPSCCPPRSTRR